MAAIAGTVNSELLPGSSGDDDIDFSQGGDDTINAGGGHDTLDAGAAFNAGDEINGGTGNDFLNLDGDYSAGVIFGAKTLVSVKTISLMNGNSYSLTTHDSTVAADDELTVNGDAIGSGSSLIFDGSAETDGSFFILSGAGNDSLTGGAKADYFVIAGGSDTVNGGGGNDTISAGGRFEQTDRIAGGAGVDTLDLDGDYSAQRVLSAATMSGIEILRVSGSQTFNLKSSDGNVASGEQMTVAGQFLNSGGKLIFDGQLETDGSFKFIDGTGDGDQFYGSQNADLFVGLGGDANLFSGLDGDDVFSMGQFLNITDAIYGGDGFDTVELAGAYTLTFGLYNLLGVEKLSLADGYNYDLSTVDGTVQVNTALEIDAQALKLAGTLTFDGSAETSSRFKIYGGSFGDRLTTGGGNDYLNGRDGIDTMAGGAGDDTYVVTAGDVVTEAGGGNDTIQTAQHFSLNGYATIENLILIGSANYNGTGNAASNQITGNAGDNRMGGGNGGVDTLTGGLGNDTYLNPAGDEIVELAGGGVDTIDSDTTASLVSLTNVENITLTGAASANAAGNAAANVLTGNTGNNILNGNGGADTMIGGAGNDIYYVDDSGDVTTELFNEGIDTVSASVSHSLKADIENLNLSGTGDISGNGNTTANVINGNAGDNILRGYEGGDTLNGKDGADILLGGTASDLLNPGTDAAKDIIRFSAAADSTGSQRDIVIGMDLAAEDVFDFSIVPTSIGAQVNSGALNLASINADLAAAVNSSLAANGAVIFDPSSGDLNVAGHVFLVVDGNGDGVYSSSQDYVVELLNSTGTLTLDDFI